MAIGTDNEFDGSERLIPKDVDIPAVNGDVVSSFVDKDTTYWGHFRNNLPLFCKGDMDAFVAVSSNNLATMLLCVSIIIGVFESNGVSEEKANDIVYSRIIPGIGVSMFFGNMFYMVQAVMYARDSNRNDICAQPFGINTPGAYVFINSIITPVFFDKLRSGAAPDDAAEFAWKVAVAANLIQGLMEAVFSLVGPFIRRVVPAVALLTSLASIGLTSLLTGSFADAAAAPIVSWVCIVILMLGYFGGVKFGSVPTSLVAMVVGTALGWMDGTLRADRLSDAVHLIDVYTPPFSLGKIVGSLDEVGSYVTLILPVSFTVAIETIQCVEFAANVGDHYNVRWSMLGDGIATCVSAAFGSVFGMTVFIGHPAFKQMGARVGYNGASAIFFVLVCFSGLAAPLLAAVAIQSLEPIIIFVGIVVCVDTLNVAPQRHFAAFIIGLAPAIASFSATQASTLLQAVAPDAAAVLNWRDAGDALFGLFLLGEGYLITSILWSAVLVCLIDRHFVLASVWCLLAAPLSFFGLVHAEKVDVYVGHSDMGWRFALAYVITAVLFLGLRVVQQQRWSVECVPPPHGEAEALEPTSPTTNRAVGDNRPATDFTYERDYSAAGSSGGHHHTINSSSTTTHHHHHHPSSSY